MQTYNTEAQSHQPEWPVAEATLGSQDHKENCGKEQIQVMKISDIPQFTARTDGRQFLHMMKQVREDIL